MEGETMNTQVATPLTVKYRGTVYPVASLEDAADKWNEFRDAAMRQGLGPDDICGHLDVRTSSGRKVARISWNGRVWPAGHEYAGAA
jgi:hypothetical protein